VARRDDLVDECGPVVWPFLLKNRNENKVQLIEERAIDLGAVFVVRLLEDEVDDEIADAWGCQLPHFCETETDVP
jgi:hypothetical protein